MELSFKNWRGPRQGASCAHHKISENAGDSEPARLRAAFVVDANETTLTTPDGR